MSWSLQFYNYDVPRWLKGDEASPPEEGKSGRNSGWRQLTNHHIVAMPDKRETLGALRGISLFTA
jgi:hypothetical protein